MPEGAEQRLLRHMGGIVLVSGVQEEQAGHLVRKALGISAYVEPAQRVADEQVRSRHAGGVQKAP